MNVETIIELSGVSSVEASLLRRLERAGWAVSYTKSEPHPNVVSDPGLFHAERLSAPPKEGLDRHVHSSVRTLAKLAGLI